MTDILFRYATEKDFHIAMIGLGIPVNGVKYYPESENIYGEVLPEIYIAEYREEELLGHVSTPPIITHQGIIRTVRFTDPEQLAKVPGVLSPTFLVDWRSDEDNEGYTPTYTADLTDTEGALYVGTVYPGRIA